MNYQIKSKIYGIFCFFYHFNTWNVHIIRAKELGGDFLYDVTIYKFDKKDYLSERIQAEQVDVSSTPWVLLLVILLVIVSAGVGIYVVMRKSDFQEIMGVETLDSKESYVQALIKQGYPEETARAHVEKHADRFKEDWEIRED